MSNVTNLYIRLGKISDSPYIASIYRNQIEDGSVSIKSSGYWEADSERPDHWDNIKIYTNHKGVEIIDFTSLGSGWTSSGGAGGFSSSDVAGYTYLFIPINFKYAHNAGGFNYMVTGSFTFNI